MWSAHLGIIFKPGSRVCTECIDSRSRLPRKFVSTAGRQTRGPKHSRAAKKGYFLRSAGSPADAAANALPAYELATNTQPATAEEVAECLRLCFAEVNSLRAENASLHSKIPASIMDHFKAADYKSLFGVPYQLINKLRPRLLAAERSVGWTHKDSSYTGLLAYLLWAKQGMAFHTCARMINLAEETCRQMVYDTLSLLSSIASEEVVPVPRDALKHHAKRGADGRVVVAVGDCVDIYVQAPGDREVKHAVYDGVHKKRYAVKFFTLVHPSGHIMCVAGPYMPAGKAEDFVIFDELMARREDLRGWFQPSDNLLLDRGFERALSVNDRRLFPGSVLLPLHSKDGTWSDKEADTSRLCTSQRWIVEQVNSHLKTFKILHSEHFPIVLLPRLHSLMLVAAFFRNELLRLHHYSLFIAFY